jgi:hypothetical protein
MRDLLEWISTNFLSFCGILTVMCWAIVWVVNSIKDDD